MSKLKLLFLIILASGICRAEPSAEVVDFESESLQHSIDKKATSKKQYKIKILDTILRVPSEASFYNKDNKKEYFDQYEGKTTLLVFWATWCSSCIQEMNQLDLLKKDFKKLPINIIALSEDYNGIESIKEFYEKNEIRYLDIYLDYKNNIFREIGVSAVPSCYIIDADGVIKVAIEGSVNWGDEKIRELILSYIDGSKELPRNSIKDESLNKIIKNKD